MSIIIASFTSTPLLLRCLESLDDQAGKPEVIVVSNRSDDNLVNAREAYPLARFIQRPQSTNVFELMSVGASTARGVSILFIEDHATAAAGWIKTLTDSLQQECKVVGGPIDNGSRGLMGWALYLSEYNRYIPPMSPGSTSSLSGANVGYDRKSLMSCKAVWKESFHDNEVHDALKAQGVTLHVISEARVISHLEMSMSEAINHLYRGGRHYGRYRCCDSAAPIRILRLTTSPAIPFVLFARLVANTLRRRPRLLGVLLLCAPIILVLIGAWSVGEVIGYLCRGYTSAKRSLSET